MFVRGMLVAAIAAVSLVLTPTAASSQTPTPSGSATEEQPKAGSAPGQEERYCETITMTGSRLAKRRFCGTRAEWAEKRMQDRQATERVQTQLCVYSKTGITGRPSC